MYFCIKSRVFGRWFLVALITAICFSTASASAAEPFVGMKAGEEQAFGALKMKFCWCPPGKFTMGSPADEAGRSGNEGPVDVSLTQGFCLGKYEVTQGQWKAVMSTTPWKGENCVKDDSEYPAVFVSWEDAMSYCKKLTETPATPAVKRT